MTEETGLLRKAMLDREPRIPLHVPDETHCFVFLLRPDVPLNLLNRTE